MLLAWHLACVYFSNYETLAPVVCADLIRGAKEKSLKVKGPVRMPTKVNDVGEHE